MEYITFYVIEISIKEMAERLDDLKWFCNHTNVLAVSTHPRMNVARLCYLKEEDAVNGLHIAKQRYETIGEVVITLDDVPKPLYEKFMRQKEKKKRKKLFI